jgi:hypothetical protein
VCDLYSISAPRRLHTPAGEDICKYCYFRSKRRNPAFNPLISCIGRQGTITPAIK